MITHWKIFNELSLIDYTVEHDPFLPQETDPMIAHCHDSKRLKNSFEIDEETLNENINALKAAGKNFIKLPHEQNHTKPKGVYFVNVDTIQAIITSEDGPHINVCIYLQGQNICDCIVLTSSERDALFSAVLKAHPNMIQLKQSQTKHRIEAQTGDTLINPKYIEILSRSRYDDIHITFNDGLFIKIEDAFHATPEEKTRLRDEFAATIASQKPAHLHKIENAIDNEGNDDNLTYVTPSAIVSISTQTIKPENHPYLFVQFNLDPSITNSGGLHVQFETPSKATAEAKRLMKLK